MDSRQIPDLFAVAAPAPTTRDIARLMKEEGQRRRSRETL